MSTTSSDRLLARSIAENITITTPGRVTWHQIRRKHRSRALAVLAWIPIIAVLVLASFVAITR